jgi:hypothetical protein
MEEDGMASAALPQHPAEVEGAAAPHGHGQIVKPGRLPVTEFAFDRAGAASPFGDDLHFPLPADRLTYVHPVEGAPPMHL